MRKFACMLGLAGPGFLDRGKGLGVPRGGGEGGHRHRELVFVRNSRGRRRRGVSLGKENDSRYKSQLMNRGRADHYRIARQEEDQNGMRVKVKRPDHGGGGNRDSNKSAEVRKRGTLAVRNKRKGDDGGEQ